MATVAIPAWTANGVLPPIDVANPTSPARSPYPVSLSDFVFRFNTSPKRRQILGGYLQYRSRLHAVGLTTGFQWLDGSFLENIEVTEARSPNDLDVVTFYRLPIGTSQQQIMLSAPDLFPTTAAGRGVMKNTFFVDAYPVSLGLPGAILVGQSAYWYSMWSHRRDATWKGYLQVDLDPVEDALAALNLQAGGTP